MESALSMKTRKVAIKTATLRAETWRAKQMKETLARKTAKQTAATVPVRVVSTYVKMSLVMVLVLTIATVLVVTQILAMKARVPVLLIALAPTINAQEMHFASLTGMFSIQEMKEDSSIAKKTAVQQHAKQTATVLLTAISHALLQHALLRRASATFHQYKAAVIRMMTVMTAMNALMTRAAVMSARIQIIKLPALMAIHALMTFVLMEAVQELQIQTRVMMVMRAPAMFAMMKSA
jgi:hypothetical protein